MNPVLYSLHSFSATAATLLVASVWQGFVIAVSVALLLRWVPGLTAAVRSAIWTAVLLLILIAPGFSLIQRGGTGSGAAAAGFWHASESWSFALLGIWAGFSLLRFAQLLDSAVRLEYLARRAAVVTPSGPIAALLRSSRRRVELCVSAEVHRPSVAGFFRPRILLPEGLLASLSAIELEHLVLHELEHLRRYDDRINLVQKLAMALVPLHPVLVWLDRQMCVERERACDDGVLRQTRARKAYAACLARLAEDSMVRRGFSLALGVLGNREHTSELSGRVHRILRAPQQPMSRRKAGCAAAGLLAGVVAAAALLTRTPELVSFIPAVAPLAASAAFVTQPVKAVLHPANGAGFTDGYSSRPAYATLTKSVMTERRSAPLHTVSRREASPAGSTQHLTLARRTLPRNPTLASGHLTLTTWTASGQRGAARTAHARVPQIISQDSQFVYAAVPFQDGWLILQL